MKYLQSKNDGVSLFFVNVPEFFVLKNFSNFIENSDQRVRKSPYSDELLFNRWFAHIQVIPVE